MVSWLRKSPIKERRIRKQAIQECWGSRQDARLTSKPEGGLSQDKKEWQVYDRFKLRVRPEVECKRKDSGSLAVYNLGEVRVGPRCRVQCQGQG